VGESHRVYAASEGWIAYCPSATATYLSTYTDVPAHSLEVDREVSEPGYDRYYWYSDAGGCMAYNGNVLGNGPESYEARHLGAAVFGAEGKLSVQKLWAYGVEGEAPERVVLNNGGRAYPYPSARQVGEGLLQLRVRGWNGVKLRLYLQDPPDDSAYIPRGSWTPKPGKSAALPYVANDNEVWADTSIPAGSWGLSAYSGGPFSESLEVRPSGDHTAVFYLKVPPRYGGDNWQIAVKKVDPKTNQEVADNVPSLSPVYTAWKRVFVERDRMFRRGNLLDHTANGGVFTADTNTDPDTIYLYRWDQTTPKTDVAKYVQPGDTVVIFDTDSPYPSGVYETATVISTDFVDVPINPANCFPPDCGQLTCQCVSVLAATLDKDLKNSYYASPLDFSSGKCAAVGVIHSADGQIYDTASNQINGPGSAFYDADLRDVKQPFMDGYVEVLAPREGMGAVPYMAGSWFDWAHQSVDHFASLHYFSNLWFLNKQAGSPPPEVVPRNSFHFVGASNAPSVGAYADTFYRYDWSYFFLDRLAGDFPDGEQREKALRWITAHELGHQFNVNPEGCQHHDGRMSWCESSSHCESGGSLPARCLMNVDPSDYAQRLTSGVCRFCAEDLLLGVEASGGEITCNGLVEPWEARDGTIRTDSDPQ